MSETSKIKSAFERVKKADGKKVARTFVILFFLFTIVFATVTNVGFKEFDFISWLANMLIMIGIMVFGLFMGESIGNDKFRENVNGLFQRNLKLYNESMAKNGDKMNFFTQWFGWRLPQELREKKIRFFVSQGIPVDNAQLIIEYCKLEDAETLVTRPVKKIDPKTKKEIFVDKIEAYQLEAVKLVLGGDYKLDAPDPSYFLTAFASAKGKLSILEKGGALQKNIKQTRTMNRIIKIAASTAVSALMASLTVHEMMGGDSTQAWLNLLSRITALGTSLFSGYLSAKITVSLEAQVIENKWTVIGLFVADLTQKIFVPKSRFELVKEKWEEAEKKDREAAANVVTPEILDGDKGGKIASIPLGKKLLK